MKTFVIMGCGHLGSIVADAYKKGLLEGYKLIGAYSKKKQDAEKLIEGTEAKAASTLDELIDLSADYLIETASITLFKEASLKALKKGTSLIPLSIGAFADKDFYNKVVEECNASGARVILPNGAVGGFDVLNTIALMASVNEKEITAGIHTHKGPASLERTPLYKEELKIKEATVFSGTTAEAISLLPTKVNVAVASALATIGPDKASATITSVPKFIGDDHCVSVETEGLKAVCDVYSANSDIAAWSVVALMRNLVSPIQFF
ncbi:MAG: DUF108 domain-containing protein [Sphaerochaetaceae bacterium]|nr:DUF108 domain-containing protein [Sphaerochaetaceae bacterium]